MSTPRFTSLEAVIDAHAHKVLALVPTSGLWGALVEFVVFGLKQAWACIFGGLMLALMIATHLWYPAEWPLHRYDFLFLAALGLQVILLVFRLETFREAKVILAFHVVGTVMELFKTSVGSWSYPEEAVFRIAAVPLFSGFMYAAVGSYLARVHRLFDLQYTRHPPVYLTIVLAIAIYANFFVHHYVWDFRYVLFASTGILFWYCQVHYRVFRYRHTMPLLLGFCLIALFIWFAENIATLSHAWLYPSQQGGWTPVSIGKFGSWFLLMIISYVLVTLVHPPAPGLGGDDGSETAKSKPLRTS